VTKHKKLVVLLIFTVIVMAFTFTTLYACTWKAPVIAEEEDDTVYEAYEDLVLPENKSVDYNQISRGQYKEINSTGVWLIWDEGPQGAGPAAGAGPKTHVMKVTTENVYLPYTAKRIIGLYYIQNIKGWDDGHRGIYYDGPVHYNKLVKGTFLSSISGNRDYVAMDILNDSVARDTKIVISSLGVAYTTLIHEFDAYNLEPGVTADLLYNYHSGECWGDVYFIAFDLATLLFPWTFYGNRLSASDMSQRFLIRRAAADESANANLESIRVNDMDGNNRLHNFSAAKLAYGTINMPYWSETADVYAWVADSKSSTYINGMMVQSYGQSASSRYPVRLDPGGSKAIEVKVTAEDKATVKIYSFTIYRRTYSQAALGPGLSDMYIEPSQLNETFATNNVNYTANVAVSCDKITVYATCGTYDRLIYVRDGFQSTGYANNEYPIYFGNNTIHIQVKAEKGTQAKDYYIVVKRDLTADLFDVTFTLRGTEIDYTPVETTFTTADLAEPWEPKTRTAYTFKNKVENALARVAINTTTLDVAASVVKPNESTELPFWNTPARDGTMTYTVNVSSRKVEGLPSVYKTYTFTITRTAPTVNTLFNVDTNRGYPSPKFFLGTEEYTITLGANVNSIIILPNSDGKKVRYNGLTENGALAYNPDGNVLPAGQTSVRIGLLCTAQDRVTTARYFLTVKRAGADASKNADLKSIGVTGISISGITSNLSLTPAFNKDTLNYTLSVPFEIETVKLSPELSDSKSTLSGTYNSVSGNSIPAGATKTLEITVTAESADSKTYKVAISRENVRDNDATLSRLNVRLVGTTTTMGTLSPTFNPTVTTDYTIDVAVPVVRLEPTATNPASYISGNYTPTGDSIAIGTDTNLTIIVTAPAGNSKTYKIKVTRYASDATVTNLKLQVGASKTGALTDALFREPLTNTNFLYYGKKDASTDTFDKTVKYARVTVTPRGGQTISGGSWTVEKENLTVGENNITFTVTAADGVTKAQYTVVVVITDPSASSNAYLSGMTIMWNNNRDWDITSWYSFDSAKTGPSTLPTNVHNVTVLPSMLLVPLNNMVIFKPTVSDPASSVSVISPAATSSSNGEYFFSGVTANTIYTFEVRAGNGSTTLQYNFKFITDENTVTAKEARLSWFEILDYTSLDISTAVFKPLQPGFSPTIGEYHISFPATVTNIIVNFKYGAATSYDPSKVTAKFSNKSGENTLSDGQFVMLGEGESTINITVKSPDGTVTKNYVVHITKASALASHDAAIKSLQTSSERQFSPTFNSNTINYSMTISEPSVTLYPVLNNAGARITGGTYNASGNKVALGQTVQITIIVTAEDATTTRTYTVTVTRPLEEIKSSDAFLKSLGVSIGNLDPAFTRERVEYIVLVPNGTNYIKLSPTKSSSRATLDFDNSTYLEEGNNIAYSDAVITIRIIAEDGVTTVTYVITVRQANIQLSDDAFLKALSVSVGTLTPAFDPLTTFYNVTVPSGTLYIKLTPVLNSDTASIVLEEGTYSETVNLLNIDSYTDIVVFVRAQDGMTELGYTVRVRQAASDLSNVALLAYLEVEDVEGWFFAPSNTMYDVEVENNVTSVKVTAITQHSGATLSGGFVSEETKTISLNVGANVIKITVTAEDGVTKKDYYVFVTRKVPTSLNFQLTIEVDGWTLTPEFDAKTSSYYCAVDFSAASINIIASAGLPTVIKEGSQTGTQAVEIGKNVFTIVAVVGSTEIYYVITVSRASAPLSNNANLKSLEIKNYTIAFDKNVTEYTLAVANNIALIVLKPTKDDAGATLSGTWIADGNTLSVGVNTITIIVTAANGSKKTYTVTVTRAGEDVSTDATLSNLTADVGALSPSFSPNVTSYNITVDGGFIVLTPTKANAGATISGDWVPEGNLVGYGTTVINIIVTAADGATKKTYIVRVTRDLSPDLDIGIDISVVGYTLTPTFDAPITTYELNVAANVSSIEIIASATNSATTVRYSESQTGIRTLNFGDNVFTVVAEVDGTIISYAIHVYRTSGNANLQNILLDVGTLSPKFNADTLNYNVTVPSTAEKIIVTPVKEAVGSTLSGTFNAGGNALDFGRNTITITVTSEDGTVKIYTVVVLRRTKAAEDLEAMLPEAEELLEFALGDDGGDIPSSAAFELADAIEEAQKILKGEQNASEEDIKAALDNLDKAMKKANAYKNGEEWNEGTGGSQPTSNEWYKNGKLWGAVGGGTAVVAGDIVLGVALMKRKKLRK